VPAPTTQSSTQESQATTSMATGGSSALGLIAFAQLQTTP